MINQILSECLNRKSDELLPFLTNEVTVNWTELLPKTWSFSIVCNHPTLIDPLLIYEILKVRPDTKVITRKQNKQKFPDIVQIQDKLDKVSLYTDNIKSIVKHIESWKWILIVPTWTLDRDFNDINVSFYDSAFKIINKTREVFFWNILTTNEFIPLVKYESLKLSISQDDKNKIRETLINFYNKKTIEK